MKKLRNVKKKKKSPASSFPNLTLRFHLYRYCFQQTLLCEKTNKHHKQYFSVYATTHQGVPRYQINKPTGNEALHHITSGMKEVNRKKQKYSHTQEKQTGYNIV